MKGSGTLMFLTGVLKPSSEDPLGTLRKEIPLWISEADPCIASVKNEELGVGSVGHREVGRSPRPIVLVLFVLISGTLSGWRSGNLSNLMASSVSI